jgi:hypothetical protein
MPVYKNVLPVGVPHVLTEDDEYNGYTLPEGALVFANIWFVLAVGLGIKCE